MRTVEKWNAQQARNFKPYRAAKWKPRKRIPVLPEVACACGKPLFYDTGTVWAATGSFVSPGIVCFACGQKGHIDGGIFSPNKIILERKA